MTDRADATSAALPVAFRGTSGTRRHGLSPRQYDYMRALATGVTIKEVADLFGVGEGTVKNTIHAVCSRLDASGKTEAFVKLGWLVVPE